MALSTPGWAGVQDVRTPATALEIAKLPEYCLGQFYDQPEYRAPRYSIGGTFPNCGPGMNHYCWGLVAVIRANRPGADSQHRSYWVGRARGEFEYTDRAMKPYPNCGLRGLLDAQMKTVEIMSKRR